MSQPNISPLRSAHGAYLVSELSYIIRRPGSPTGEQSVVFNPDKPQEVPAALQKSRDRALTEWFELNKHEAEVQLPDATLARDRTVEKRSSTDLLYPELPELYVLKMPKIHWSRAVHCTFNEKHDEYSSWKNVFAGSKSRGTLISSSASSVRESSEIVQGYTHGQRRIV